MVFLMKILVFDILRREVGSCRPENILHLHISIRLIGCRVKSIIFFMLREYIYYLNPPPKLKSKTFTLAVLLMVSFDFRLVCTILHHFFAVLHSFVPLKGTFHEY